MASPYTPPETPVGASWEGHAYDYDDAAQPGIPHAVKSVDRPGTDSTALTYDANGNTTCRVEVLSSVTTTFLYVYNDENRLSVVEKIAGTTPLTRDLTIAPSPQKGEGWVGVCQGQSREAALLHGGWCF